MGFASIFHSRSRQTLGLQTRPSQGTSPVVDITVSDACGYKWGPNFEMQEADSLPCLSVAEEFHCVSLIASAAPLVLHLQP
jgi:hypothetical protein